MSLLRTDSQPETSLPTGVPERSAVTWRSVLLGVVGVVFICGLTAYNDFVVANTFLVGNYLPVGLLLLFVVFSLLLNAPLSRFLPRHALSTREVAVAFAMALVSCSLPSSGLMRYLPANLVMFHAMAGQSADHREALLAAGAPDWAFPTPLATDPGSDIAARANDPVVKYFIARNPIESESFIDRFLAVPWAAWLTPALSWGVLLAFLASTILCMAVIVRRQWADNERLPFPLADVFLTVVEQPRPGHALTPLLASPVFWIATALVFSLHSINALHAFYPRYIPQFPLGYDFNAIFTTQPLVNTEWYFKRQTLYFSVVGLVFFLQTAVSFSLWFFIVLVQLVVMTLSVQQLEYTDGMRQDQNFGAVVAITAAILWVGRAHWWMVLKQMLRGPAEGEPRGRYLPYPLAGWGLLLSLVGTGTWLHFAGASLAGAVVIPVLMLMFFLVAARVIAETGIPFMQVYAQVFRFWTLLAPMGIRTSTPSFFWTAWFHGLFVHDMRESAAVFSTQALRVTDLGAYESARGSRRTWPVIACLVAALSLGFLVSGTSMLYVEYSYASTLDKQPVSPINGYAVSDTGQPAGQVINPTLNYSRGGTGANDQHSPLAHFAGGTVFTAFLAAMRLRFTAWPLHPVGFLLCNTFPMRMIWFSIFLGWLAKFITVRFGGIELFRNLKPLFLGLIIGEAAAVAFWLVINLILVQLGIPFTKTSILPT
jgi:hypothetical protein